MRISNYGYIERKTAPNVYREWWIAKKSVALSALHIPKHLEGRKFRLKFELIEDE